MLGLATDYCVKFTALDAAAHGYKTRLLTEGCRGVELNRGDIARAIEEMRNAGVEIQ
ncbi:MAG: isochorismatase family protein [Planctomycetota bacterium]